MKKSILLTLLLSFILSQSILALKPKVTIEELEEKFYPSNKDAVAAVLEESKRVFYKYEQNNGFKIIRKVYTKIKIYKKDGLHLGIQKVLLWKNNSSEETISKLKAKTYNLLNGKIEEFQMKKEGVFEDDTAPDRNTVKFTLPNVLEGSVIEFSYQIVSPYYIYFPTFYFQQSIPIKKQKLEIEIPEYFNYKVQMRGDKNINLTKGGKNDKITFRQKYTSGGDLGTTQTSYETHDVDFTVNTYTIRLENVEAYKKEPYVSNIYSYLPSIEFDLTSIQYPYSTIKNFSNTWETVLKKHQNHWAFKDELEKNNYYKKDLEELVGKISDYKTKVYKIFDFVRNKMTWNNIYSSKAYGGVKNAYKNSTGNSGQINIMLLSMLKNSKINARPVFVSTQNVPLAIFPNYNAFNYCITEVIMPDNSKVYLDATDKKAIPNILPERVIKGQGKVLTSSGKVTPINLRPKTSTINTLMSFKIDEEGVISGKYKNQSKSYDAYMYRNSSKSNIEKEIEDVKEEIGITEVENYNREGFKELDKNLDVNYEFSSDELTTVVDDEIYFNPLLFLKIEKNPFKLEERKYPIDYGYAKNKNFMINISIPEGYIVSSLPKNASVKLPEDLGVFQYMAVANGNTIQLRIKKQFKKPFIDIQFYPLIKEFMNQLVNKENEQIVLKKA